jgi:hypothetical protein
VSNFAGSDRAHFYVALPVTVPATERSFCKLETIKNNLRNAMGPIRLQEFLSLAPEAFRAKSIDIHKLTG